MLRTGKSNGWLCYLNFYSVRMCARKARVVWQDSLILVCNEAVSVALLDDVLRSESFIEKVPSVDMGSNTTKLSRQLRF